MIDKRLKKNQIAILSAKTEAGKLKLSYHGEKWHIIEIAIPKLIRSKGECYVCRSRDGSKILFIPITGDPDIILQKV